jgi:tetratricopeptide (TPR) repeat protein
LKRQDKTVFRIVQREIALLLFLCIIALSLFFFTRLVAAKYRNLEAASARSWFQFGDRMLREGDTEEAATAFRNAALNQRGNAQYTLALAGALVAANHLEEAQHVLLRLRDAAPEKGEVNLTLAQLAAKQGNIEDAVHYYHTALYGIWPPDGIEMKLRGIRVELVRLLLDHDDKNRALSELLALSRDLSQDDAQVQTQAGQLFLEASDPQHALERFLLALQVDSNNVEALVGAGRSEFELQSYAEARKHLRAAVKNGAEPETARELLQITEAILLSDPLAPGLSSTERSRRLIQGFRQASERLTRCQAEGGTQVVESPLFAGLRTEVDAAAGKLSPATLRRDAELLRSSLNLIYRIEIAAQTCGKSSPLDRALVLIARKHGVVEQ